MNFRQTKGVSWRGGASPVARMAQAQDRAGMQADVPLHKPRAVAKLFQSPEGHPNSLDNTNEELWIAEEISERAYLVDWTGKVLHKVDTESHNTSGIAVGGGFLWMSANGRGVGRDPRPTDRPGGEILQCDLKTGKTIRRFVPSWPGGLHGATWNDKTQTLWLVAVGINALLEVDPKDNFRIGHIVPTRLSPMDWTLKATRSGACFQTIATRASLRPASRQQSKRETRINEPDSRRYRPVQWSGYFECR